MYLQKVVAPLKPQSSNKSPRDEEKLKVFGCTLQEIMKRQTAEGVADKIPVVVSMLIDFLENEGFVMLSQLIFVGHLQTVGLFRESGSALKIKELKDTVDRGLPLDLAGDVQNYLKIFQCLTK